MTAFTVHQTDWATDGGPLSAIRRSVFIEEQGVPEALEWDSDDSTSIHLLALTLEGEPIGCARLLPDGHIGRMAVIPHWRCLGVGTALLSAALGAARAQGHARVKLSAQLHAAGFYTLAGFETIGGEYLEAGIPHVAMQFTLHSRNSS